MQGNPTDNPDPTHMNTAGSLERLLQDVEGRPSFARQNLLPLPPMEMLGCPVIVRYVRLSPIKRTSRQNKMDDVEGMPLPIHRPRRLLDDIIRGRQYILQWESRGITPPPERQKALLL